MAELVPLFLDTGSIEVVTGSKIIDLIHFPVTASNEYSSSYGTLLPDPYLFAIRSANITNAANTTSSSLFEFRLSNRVENYFYPHNSIVGVSTSATTTGVRIGIQTNFNNNAFANIKVSSTLTAHTIACVGTSVGTTFALPASMAAINTIYPCFVKALYSNPTSSDALRNIVLLQPETNNTVTAHSGSVSYNKFVGYKLDRGLIQNNFGLFRVDPNFAVGQTIKIQSDRKILIGGAFDTYYSPINNVYTSTSLVRINPNGSPDTNFQKNISPTGAVINAILEQPDKKIVIGGSFSEYSGSSVSNITRLNSDGSIDTTFKAGGGTNDVVYSLALQSDNKILVGGNFTTYSGSSSTGIIRLNTSGSVDTTFDTGGGVDSTVRSIAIQSDRKILIGGTFSTYSGSTPGNSIARINLSGSLDTTFATGGGFLRTSFPIEVIGTIYSLVVQPDNKILVGGDFLEYSGSIPDKITRLNSDGSIDTVFSSSPSFGFLIAGPTPEIYTIALQSTNPIRILVGGNFTTVGSIETNYITRLNTIGEVDNTFSGSLPGFNDPVKNLVTQSDGKIIAVGNFTTFNGYNQYGVTRLNSDGTINLGLPAIETAPLYYSTGSLKIISGSDTLTSSFLPPTASLWFSQSLAANVANTSNTGYATVFTLTGLTTGKTYLANLYMIGVSAAAATGFRMRVTTGSAYRGTLYIPTSTTAPAIRNSEDGANITSIAAGTWPTVNTKYLVYGDYTFVKGAQDPQVQILSETNGTAVTAFSGSVIFYRAID
jgi:uncharacterized delta-60 repeat protein